MRKDGLAASIGRLLALERGRARLSQAALAARLHMTQQWISRVERGADGVSLHTVERLFRGLGRQLRFEVESLGPDRPAPPSDRPAHPLDDANDADDVEVDEVDESPP